MGAGRPPQCKICGTKLNVKTAYMVVTRSASGKETKKFYCSQEEYEAYVLEKQKKLETKKAAQEKKRVEKAQQPKKKRGRPPKKKVEIVVEKIPTDRDKAYQLICEILGKQQIINTALWKEWKEWNTVASDEVIGKYLAENKEWMSRKISSLGSTEFGCIRYLSAILKNNLGDFKPKTPEAAKPKVQVDETFYGHIATRNNKRRSLEDLEDNY